MKTMREAYQEYVALYGPHVEPGSLTDATLRGAFSAGVVHGLGIARLSPQAAIDALDRMSADLGAFWEKDPPQ